ncbi:MAG: Hint domain-containing protein [Paracoccaceae bacterium]|nr:Hint domain-containing protein [Paracoccaceae bacterium]
MSYDRPIAPRSAHRSHSLPADKPWTVRTASRPLRPAVQSRPLPLTRRFELEWLDADGMPRDLTKIAPALPAFEEAFAGFTHGTLIQTAEGPVAVEDLAPGTELQTSDGRTAPLLWKGAITIVPGAPTLRAAPEKLYRVTADAFGLGRPARDVLLGPDARLLNRDPGVRAAVGAEAAFVPVSCLADGISVIEVTPMAPIRVYHLVTARHHTVFAGGLEVETFAPRASMPESLSHEMLAVFMTLFPHLSTLRDFGRARWPRMSPEMMAAVG